MIDHRVTKTKLFSLLRKREGQEGFDAGEISSRVALVIKEVWPILQNVTRHFPLYTLHDPGHGYRVAEHMAAITPPETLKSLNCIELSLLIYSAYLHDIGMSATQEEFYRWIDSDDYAAFLSANPEWNEVVEKIDVTRRVFVKSRNEQAKGDVQEGELASTQLRRLQDMLYTDYLRQHHATRGYDYILSRFGMNGTSDNKIRVGEVNYAEQVAMVCRSHWENSTTLKSEKFRRDLYIGSYPINLQYAAVLLRLADVIDLDPERTPKALMDYLMLDFASRGVEDNPLDEAALHSAKEWAKHRAIIGIKATPDEIRLEARCSHPAIQRGLRDWCSYIDLERRNCRLVIQDNVREIADKYVLRLTEEVRPDYIQSDGSYIYNDFRFSLDYDRIVNLLMGTALWGDPLLLFRELLQNALDACHHRAALSRRLEMGYTPKIIFSIGSPELLLSCEDNGTGMDQHVIENYLTRVGRSYYSSSEFRRQNLEFEPISHFGLGIMSCFMVADRLHIETQRMRDLSPEATPLSVELDVAGRYVVLRQVSKSREGTKISLIAHRSEQYARFSELLHSRNHRSVFYPAVAVLRSFAIRTDIPIIVRDADGAEATITGEGFHLPEIDWHSLPCLRSCHKEYVFTYTYDQTGGLAGVFRFLLPVNVEGRVCLATAVRDYFQVLIDPDGDLCLGTPDYRDKRVTVSFSLPDDWSDDWSTEEIRGVYRQLFGRRPDSDRYTNSDLLEIVKGSFRWTQDGLAVGLPMSRKPEEHRERHSESSHRDTDRDTGSADLFTLVPVPGLNAADIDLRGRWRLALNVQRTDFDRSARIAEFRSRYYDLIAEMWSSILESERQSEGFWSDRMLTEQLMSQSNWELRRRLEPLIA